MGENFVYRYGDNLYVNLTNRCCNDCVFCIRNNGDGIGDSGDLWLSREPSADEVIEGIKKHGEFNELVFCGYGEPTYREVSVSLNNDNAESYDRVCRSIYGLHAFAAMLEFTAECVKAGIETIMSVVAVDGVNIDKCRAIAEKTGAKLRVREYIK